MNDEGSATRYRAPALEKGLDILELLAARSSGMSMTAIAAELGRSMGEIYRIAVALEARGYIRREDDGESFALSMRLFELATEHPPINRLLSVALPEMQRLADATQQSCHLGLVSSGMLLVVAQTESPSPMHYSVRLGARFPLLETSSGAVYLAFSKRPDDVRLAKQQSPQLAADADQRLADIRLLGGERRTSLVVDGVTNISWPVFDHRGLVAVVTVPFLRQRNLEVDVELAEREVIATSQRITASLGGQVHQPPKIPE